MPSLDTYLGAEVDLRPLHFTYNTSTLSPTPSPGWHAGWRKSSLVQPCFSTLELRLVPAQEPQRRCGGAGWCHHMVLMTLDQCKHITTAQRRVLDCTHNLLVPVHQKPLPLPGNTTPKVEEPCFRSTRVSVLKCCTLIQFWIIRHKIN